MSPADLDTLAKAPLLVYLGITYANQGPTEVDSHRFKEFLGEAVGSNARTCVYTDVMRHLAANIQRLGPEVSNETNTAPLTKAIRPLLGEKMPPDERMRFLSHLGRIAFAAARDDAGNPVPERITALQALREGFGFQSYNACSRRFTDKLEVLDYWPGNDPALKRFSDAELRKLAGVFGVFFATLTGCHGHDPDDSQIAAVQGWLMNGYTEGQEACAAHALLRYLDQLFMLTQTEVQYAQSSLPLFVEGRALMLEKFNTAEQAVFMQFFESLGAALVTPGSPAAAHQMLGKITALMKGEPVPDETLSEEEWDVLSLGLVASFLLVAAADGQVGDKEMEAFAGIIEALCEVTHLGLAVQAAARISDNMHKLWSAVTSGKSPTPQYVVDALQLAAGRLAEVEFDAYRQIAMTIAQKTAEAEGGGFLGLGSKISADERKVLDGLKKLLGLA